MHIEPLAVDNLREGVFCAHGSPYADEMYDQLEAWLAGEFLRGQIAKMDDNQPVGFTLYYPIERAMLDVQGAGLYMMQCLFVKPDFFSRGVGRALVEAAIADARQTGATGLAVEGFHGLTRRTFEYMPAAFFEHMGMAAAESRGAGTLYYVRFADQTEPPRYLERKVDFPPGEERIRVDILDCRRCYVRITNREVAKAVMEREGAEKFDLFIHDQNSRHAIVDKGMSSGIFIDGELTFFSGPVSEEDVLNALIVADQAREQKIDR